MLVKEPFLLRSLRLGCVLIAMLHVVASTSDNFEVDASGNVRKTDALPEEVGSQPIREENHKKEDIGVQNRQEEQGEEPSEEPQFADDSRLDECGLYLAPSTIKGAGLGMFSTYHRSIGEAVGFGEIVIPIYELKFYNGGKENLFNPFQHYYWKGAEKGLHGIVGDNRVDEVQGVVPGLDAAINCNLALINVDQSGGMYENCNLHRNRDPMAGAMTPYHTTPSPVIRDIPPGGELFKFYGDRWFVAREDTFGLIPLSEDYPVAQKVVEKFDKLRQDHFSSNPQLKTELWSLAKDTIGTTMWESRKTNALPQQVDDVQKAAESEIASLHQPQAIRSIEFLRQYGKCMDSIRPGLSTLESGQGGLGGFATRRFSKGDIITGTPLHHIPNKELFTIYRMERKSTDDKTGDETWLRHLDDIPGHQMMVNYCYGHPESSLLLCPYGSNIGYINHNKSLANVKIQWAEDGVTMHNQAWLESQRLEDMGKGDYQVRLAFDYVATKDIAKGEEVFLDYGDEFEQALTEHMSEWEAPPYADFDDYIPAEVYNKDVSKSALRTDEEQKQEAYPKNLEIRCHPGLVEKHRPLTSEQKRNGIIWETRDIGYPCRILERYSKQDSEKNESLYRVELTVPLEEVGLQFFKDKFNHVRKKDVHRSAISFFNKPYTTDLFLKNMFRKEIGIPDIMFPEHWKTNLVVNERKRVQEFKVWAA